MPVGSRLAARWQPVWVQGLAKQIPESESFSGTSIQFKTRRNHQSTVAKDQPLQLQFASCQVSGKVCKLQVCRCLLVAGKTKHMTTYDEQQELMQVRDRPNDPLADLQYTSRNAIIVPNIDGTMV
jgi:hypothetical protein